MGLPERLSEARRRVGFTGSQIQQRTGIGESSLSEFESGKREPRLAQLRALAEVYQRSLSYFLSEEEPPRQAVLWRQRPAEKPEEIEARFLRLCEQYRNLEVWCGERVQSSLPEARGSAATYRYDDAEELANRVRNELQLGDHPAHALLRVLEDICGVKIFHLPFEPTGTAASTRNERFGMGILLNARNVRWRRNHDLAHELFHLLTWTIYRGGTEVAGHQAPESEEKLATCFAVNLLMPAEAVRVALNRGRKDGKTTFQTLYDVARQFDVSAESLLWRMHFLFNRPPEEADRTKAQIENAKKRAPIFEDRQARDTRPPPWPERYHALAVKALRRGEMSLGRFAEYLEISRQEAAAFVEQEADESEEVSLPPA